MTKLYTFLSLSLSVGIASQAAFALPLQRIPIDEDKSLEIYALGAGSNRGVFKVNPTDYSTAKISGTTYIQYAGSASGGGGVFLDNSTVVGIKNAGSSSSFLGMAFEATAQGGEDGTWSHTFYGNPASTVTGKVYDMAYDSAKGDIYCWYEAGFFQYALGKYDRATRSITRVGSAASASIYALAIDSKGDLWGLGSYGMIYSIDKTTGQAVEKTGGNGSILQYNTNMPISASIDPATDKMYVVGRLGYYDTFSTLGVIDLADLSATKLGVMDGDYNCLSIAASPINDKAPADAAELRAEFNGSKSVVTFTAPSRTFGDLQLNGELEFTVSSDDGQTATGTVAAGAEKSVEMDLADGTREISVSFSNGYGEGPAKKTTFFAGYDTPTNISGLTISANGSEVELRWNMPAGEHNGMFNAELLSFSVSRDGNVIKTGLTTPEFTETVDGAPVEHRYEIATIYNDEALHTSSTAIVAGQPYEMPYSLDFSTVESFGKAGVTIVDPNTGNIRVSPTWAVANDPEEGTFFTSPALDAVAMYAYCRTDFLYLPPMKFEAGVNYRLSFNAASKASLMNQEAMSRLRVVLASAPTGDLNEVKDIYHDSNSLTGDTLTIKSVYDKYDWTAQQLTFSVETDGVYSIAFLDWAPTSYNHYYTVLKDIAIEAVYVTPKPVSNLVAEPQADNNRNIDLRFTLPSTDTDGNPLAEISKVEITRGTTSVATLTDDLKPGAEITFTDENAPRGLRSYSVVVYCGPKASTREMASVKCGYINNLIITDVEYSSLSVPVNGEASVTVTVVNDGFERVLDGAYAVFLKRNGETAGTKIGLPLATDETATYEFPIYWMPDMPETVVFNIEVEFDGDEDLSDNVSPETSIEFEQITNSIENVGSGADVVVKATDGVITVAGAQGLGIEVISTTGSKVTSIAAAPEVYTFDSLAPGVYIVKVGVTVVKVAL